MLFNSLNCGHICDALLNLFYFNSKKDKSIIYRKNSQ